MATIEPKIFDELRAALSTFGDKYFVGEELNRSILTDDLRAYDEALLSRLFEIDFIKQHYIKEVAGQNSFRLNSCKMPSCITTTGTRAIPSMKTVLGWQVMENFCKAAKMLF